MTAVWLAWERNGFYEGDTLLAVASTRELAQRKCAEHAAPARVFLGPPQRPVTLSWRDTPFDDDDRDEAREHTRWSDDDHSRGYRVERHEVLT